MNPRHQPSLTAVVGLYFSARRAISAPGHSVGQETVALRCLHGQSGLAARGHHTRIAPSNTCGRDVVCDLRQVCTKVQAL